MAVVSQVMWTDDCERSIQLMEETDKALDELYSLQLSQLSQLTKLIRGKLTSIQRKVIVALITQDVHGRDIVEQLKEEEVFALDEFVWQQ